MGEPGVPCELVEASAEIIFPLPLVEDQRAFRPVIFFDAGNVFDSDCPAFAANCIEPSADEIRYSYGIGITWLSAMGPMTFGYVLPLNDKEFDETEKFQFELGRTF